MRLDSDRRRVEPRRKKHTSGVGNLQILDLEDFLASQHILPPQEDLGKISFVTFFWSLLCVLKHLQSLTTIQFEE